MKLPNKLSAPIYRLKRRAKALSLKEKIPLHEALDRIAGQEGFAAWSLLASRLASSRPGKTLIDELVPGDLVLLGARPGHGKTLIAAYMIGSRGRAIDGILLGIIVTFTHTFSVITLGIVATLLSGTFSDETLHAWLGLVSAILILMAGFYTQGVVLGQCDLSITRHNRAGIKSPIKVKKNK